MSKTKMAAMLKNWEPKNRRRAPEMTIRVTAKNTVEAVPDSETGCGIALGIYNDPRVVRVRVNEKFISIDLILPNGSRVRRRYRNTSLPAQRYARQIDDRKKDPSLPLPEPFKFRLREGNEFDLVWTERPRAPKAPHQGGSRPSKGVVLKRSAGRTAGRQHHEALVTMGRS